MTLLAVAVIFFGVAVAIGVVLIPEPRTPTDFLVIGTTATLVSLIVVFAMLITTIYKSGDNFVRRKPRPNELPPTETDDTTQT